jgi:signal transduction histidine kinase
MGAALGRVLTQGDVHCVTTLAGRGDQTALRCRDTGIEVLDSFADVVRQADVVLSVVPPSAAEGIADLYCRHAGLAPAGALFVDVNSTSPELAASLAARIEDRGVGFQGRSRNGLGLVSMRERAELVHGRIEFLEPPGGGALVRFTVPVSVEESHVAAET